jgi:hypothetical protein
VGFRDVCLILEGDDFWDSLMFVLYVMNDYSCTVVVILFVFFHYSLMSPHRTAKQEQNSILA